MNVRLDKSPECGGFRLYVFVLKFGNSVMFLLKVAN